MNNSELWIEFSPSVVCKLSLEQCWSCWKHLKHVKHLLLRSLRVLMLLKKQLERCERDGGGSRCSIHRRRIVAFWDFFYGLRNVSWYKTSVFSSRSHSQLHRRMRGELLSILSCMADLSNAIHWMPPGFLWAGRFPNWLVGLMGTISSMIGLIQMGTGSSDQTNST